MSADTVSIILQTIVGLGLLNVWLVRSRSATDYRGGDAQSLKEEFATYGLPEWLFYLVGVLKIGSAALLLVGIVYPPVVLPAAAVVVVLMVGALIMHAKIKDPPIKSLPAFVVLLMSGAICYLAIG